MFCLSLSMGAKCSSPSNDIKVCKYLPKLASDCMLAWLCSVVVVYTRYYTIIDYHDVMSA